jgi:tRNA nucleotidyltransferase (CCA-adding enzyme)
VAERVWQELARGLMEARPSRVFEVLTECGAAEIVLPELAALMEGAAGARRLAALDMAAERGFALPTRFALIALKAGEQAIESLCARLRVPQDCRELAIAAARYCKDVSRSAELPAEALLALLQATDALRRPERFAQLLEVCAVTPDAPASTAAVSGLKDALAAAHAVDAGAIARRCTDPGQIKDAIAKARIAAIAHAR